MNDDPSVPKPVLPEPRQSPGDATRRGGGDVQTSSLVQHPPGALHVRCPYCHVPLDLSDDQNVTSISCELCGNHFSLVSMLPTLDFTGTSKTIGRFTLLQQVGVGRYGAVWKARDNELDRIVAVKIPRVGHLNEVETEQFLREARAAAQVRHPSIVSMHEVGRDGESLYIVSDFIQGANLQEWLTGQRLTAREAAAICVKIADALHAAHEAGVVHRDLKPANIMMDMAGEPYLTDFGLARRQKTDTTMTVEGRLLGTPAYMSPEQARGEGHLADARSDIYSLGVILFELLTGEPPFRGDLQMLLVQVLRDEPPSPRKLNHRVPHDLETVCLKCLEKDPARRYATAGDLREDLQRCLRGQPVHARPVGLIGRLWRWYCRDPSATAQVAGVYAIFCSILLMLWGVEGVLVYALGIDRSRDAGQAILEIVLLMASMYLPSLCAGIGALWRKGWALWLGLSMSLLGCVLACCGLIGVVGYAGVFSDPRLRIGLLLLLADLALLAVVAFGAAIVSRYSRSSWGAADSTRLTTKGR